MPPKATGKRKADPAKPDSPSTVKNARQRPAQPTSATSSTPVSVASAAPSPVSSSSSASSSSTSAAGSVYRLKIYLAHSSPLIWRQLLVHSTTSLYRLHLILQVLFDWLECHQHQFALPLPATPVDTPADRLLYGLSSDSVRLFRDGNIELEYGEDKHELEEDERRFTVGELLPTVGNRLVYEYDYGDSWHHWIEVEAIEPATAASSSELPHCTGGRFAAPAEDSGGISNHSEMVRRYVKHIGLLEREQNVEQRADNKQVKEEDKQDASSDGEHGDSDKIVEEWLEQSSSLMRTERAGFEYDPLHFDRRTVNRILKLPFHDPLSLGRAVKRIAR